MTKRDSRTRQAKSETTSASGAATADPMEQRLVAFAEQLGRIVGTIHAKAEGWLERENVSKQIASVRDGAALRGRDWRMRVGAPQDVEHPTASPISGA